MDHRFGVAAFVLCGLLIACSGGRPDDPPVRTARTGRFELTIVASDADRTVTLRSSGSFDLDRGAYSLVADGDELLHGLGTRFAIVATPDVVFVDCPYLAHMLDARTKWISVRGAGGELLRSWIDDPLDGLVPGTTMRFADGSNEGDVLVSLEYFDVGAPVVIDPPAVADVTDETDAFNRLFGGTTGG